LPAGLARGAGRPELVRLVRGRDRAAVLFLVRHDNLAVAGVGELTLLVGGFPPGVVGVGHLVRALVRVRALPRPRRRGAFLLLGLVGLLVALLLAAAVLLVRHGCSPVEVGRAKPCSG